MTAADPITGTQRPPGVVKWFKVYCGFLCFLYACVSAASLFFFLAPPEELDMTASGAHVMGVALLGVGVFLFGVCLLPFVVAQRPWVWGYGLGLICLGMTSACLLPACIPLLIFWLKPEAKEYFRKG